MVQAPEMDGQAVKPRWTMGYDEGHAGLRRRWVSFYSGQCVMAVGFPLSTVLSDVQRLVSYVDLSAYRRQSSLRLASSVSSFRLCL